MVLWRKTETWKDLVSQCEKATSEAEALGLLHIGARLRDSGERTPEETGPQDHARCFNYKVPFFLDMASTGNSILASTARRLIVIDLLRESLELSWTGLVGPTHGQLVNFLGDVHNDLKKPPFPGTVNDFLFQSFFKWKAREREEKAPDHRKRETDKSRVSKFSDEYNQTERLVRACVAWGALPEVLVRQWFTPEMLQEIKVIAEPLLLASLGDDEDLRIRRVRGSLTWAMTENRLTDLYNEGGQTQLWMLNGITVNFLRGL